MVPLVGIPYFFPASVHEVVLSGCRSKSPFYTKSDKREALANMQLLNIDNLASRSFRHLSGGQQQRVSIARALAGDPSIILADEPTGALDSSTGRLIMDIFHKLNKERGITIVLITHSNELAEETQRILTLHDGRIIGERKGSGKIASL